jgi:hypothetical protein
MKKTIVQKKKIEKRGKIKRSLYTRRKIGLFPQRENMIFPALAPKEIPD